VKILLTFLLGVSILGSVVGCGSPSSLPRLGRLTAAELLASDTIVVARAGRVHFGGELNVDRRKLKIARVSLLDVVSIQGSLGGTAEFTVYVPAEVSAESRDTLDSDVPSPGQWRIFFLRWEGPQLRSVRDANGYSFPTASEMGAFRILPAEPISLTIVKLLLVPSSGNIQSPYPHSIGSMAEFVSIPLIGRAKTFRILEEALLTSDREIQARTCESLLYMTGLPHRCLNKQLKLSGEFADKGIRDAVEVQRESFLLLRMPEVARKAVIARCLANLSLSLDKKINPREDCIDFADAALSASSPDWNQ